MLEVRVECRGMMARMSEATPDPEREPDVVPDAPAGDGDQVVDPEQPMNPA